MNWYSATKRGFQHKVHCEDAAVVAQIGKTRWLAAVIDGDSNGRESHFASTLFAKILRRMGNELFYFDNTESEEKSLIEIQELVLLQLMEELSAFKGLLFLEEEELLSTLLFALVDTSTKEAEILVIGQGVIVVNGEAKCFQAEGKPDYLVYHLEDDFDQWFKELEGRISIKEFEDISIATDGFFTFNIEERNPVCESGFIHDFLFLDETGKEDCNMMEQKLVKLEEEHNVFPKDDIAMIRLMNG